jgi:hypothetical protein
VSASGVSPSRWIQISADSSAADTTTVNEPECLLCEVWHTAQAVCQMNF